jgi:hypothetical protein
VSHLYQRVVPPSSQTSPTHSKLVRDELKLFCWIKGRPVGGQDRLVVEWWLLINNLYRKFVAVTDEMMGVKQNLACSNLRDITLGYCVRHLSSSLLNDNQVYVVWETSRFSFIFMIQFCIKCGDWRIKTNQEVNYILKVQNVIGFNPLTPELNPSAQRCLTRFFTGNFASWTVHFVNICIQNQQIHQLFIQFINYVW